MLTTLRKLCLRNTVKGAFNSFMQNVASRQQEMKAPWKERVMMFGLTVKRFIWGSMCVIRAGR
jgi:hypothetical protein